MLTSANVFICTAPCQTFFLLLPPAHLSLRNFFVLLITAHAIFFSPEEALADDSDVVEATLWPSRAILCEECNNAHSPVRFPPVPCNASSGLLLPPKIGLQREPNSILPISSTFSLRELKEVGEDGDAMPIHGAPEAALHREETVNPVERSSALIREVVEEEITRGQRSPHEIVAALEESVRFETQEVQLLVRQYIVGLLKLAKYGASVAELPQGIGGLYDGRVRIAEATVQPDEQAPDVITVLARIEETNEHEGYHARYHHEQPLIVSSASAEQGITVTIGNEKFREQEELVEALVVLDTGHRFVSEEYRQRMQKLLHAIDTSPTVTLEDVREAVNGHDVTSVDATTPAAEGDAGAIAGTVEGSGEGVEGTGEVRKAA